jgi:spore germination cell wall hydrolase CwlJ-like protein
MAFDQGRLSRLTIGVSLIFLGVAIFYSMIDSFNRRSQEGIIVTAIDVPTQPQPSIDEKELQCLAENIYHEARNQSEEGQLAVASVTFNRVNSKKFPDTVCGVVYQRNKRGCQFTWLCKNRVVRDWRTYNEILEMSREIMTGEIPLDYLDDALYYHAYYVRPRWRNHMQYVTRIGAHIFYRS